MDEHEGIPPAPLGEPDAAAGGVGRLTKQVAIGLLIWVGVNVGVFLGASLLAFWAFRTLSIAQETAFVYSLFCAIPLALIVSAFVAGRRVVKMLKEPM